MNIRILFPKALVATPFLFAVFGLTGSLRGEERIALVGEVHSGYLLGGAREGSWMEADVAKKRVSSGHKFRTYALDGPTGRAAITAKLAPGREPSPETALLDFASDDARTDPVLAVSCPWNPAPRKTQVCDPDNKTYQDAAAEVLKAAGVVDPHVRVNQILRVDLDGDGEEEAIVTANTFAPRPPDDDHPEIKPLPFHAPGGFHSLVFVRRLIGDTVQTTVLTQEIAHPGKGRGAMPVTRQVVAVLDLNGDGRMEVVISGRYYEGDWLDVFDIEGLAARKVLSVGSGA
jgi:hypothetical protein